MSGIPSWARVGAAVICIGEIEDLQGIAGLVVTPVVGATYVIRAIRLHPFDSEPCIQLVEIVNAKIRVADDGLGVVWNGEPWFVLSRFKPAVSLSSDIATHFTALLDVREPVEA